MAREREGQKRTEMQDPGKMETERNDMSEREREKRTGMQARREEGIPRTENCIIGVSFHRE